MSTEPKDFIEKLTRSLVSFFEETSHLYVKDSLTPLKVSFVLLKSSSLISARTIFAPSLLNS